MCVCVCVCSVAFFLLYQVLASHTAPSGCGYCRCTAWNANGSWVAAATEEGRVEVMRVCDVKETESELMAGEGPGSATLENCKCIDIMCV